MANLPPVSALARSTLDQLLPDAPSAVPSVLASSSASAAVTAVRPAARPVPSWQWPAVLSLFFGDMHAALGLPFLPTELRNMVCEYAEEGPATARYRLVFAGYCSDCNDVNFQDGRVPFIPEWEGGRVQEMSSREVRSLLTQQMCDCMEFTLHVQLDPARQQAWAEWRGHRREQLHERIQKHFEHVSTEEWLRCAGVWEQRLRTGVWHGAGGVVFPVPKGLMVDPDMEDGEDVSECDRLHVEHITAAFRLAEEELDSASVLPAVHQLRNRLLRSPLQSSRSSDQMLLLPLRWRLL